MLVPLAVAALGAALALAWWLLRRHRAQRELEAEFAARDRSFIFNAWFESVKAVTFPSAAVPLTKEDIEALARAADDALALIPSTKTRACDSACLEALASKLDAAVATVAGSGAFVRLNYLSPKDAVMDNLEQLGAAAKWPAIQEDVRNSMPGSVDHDVVRAISVVRLTLSLTKVQSGHEALWMLTHSHRTFEDFWMKRLRLETEPSEGSVDHIQVRRWEDRLLPETELRGFVFRRTLTALTQYHCCTTVPMFLERGQAVAKEVDAFFTSKVKPSLEMDSFVIDFAFLKGGGLCVVELNPFGPQTGALLFDWHKDALTLAAAPRTGPPAFRYVRRQRDCGGAGQMPIKQVLDALDAMREPAADTRNGSCRPSLRRKSCQ